MTTKEKLEKVLKEFQVECLNFGLDSLLDAILEINQPAPLDPRTCELCVGDVCRCVDNDEFYMVMYIDAEEDDYNCISLNGGVNLTHDYFFRLDLILTQRAGVQIGEE